MNNHYNALQLKVSLDDTNRNLSIGLDQLEDFGYLEPFGLYLRRLAGLDITCTFSNKIKSQVYSLFFRRLGLVPFNIRYRNEK
jgi:hypothetical protein